MKSIGSYSGSDAQRKCAENNGDLPYPANAEENNLLVTAMRDFGIETAWLGLSDAHMHMKWGSHSGKRLPSQKLNPSKNNRLS